MKPSIQSQLDKLSNNHMYRIFTTILIVLLFVWSGTAIHPENLQTNGLQVAGNILSGIFHPDTALLLNFTTTGVPYLLLETVCIAFLGTLVGGIISIPFAFLSAENVVSKPVAVLFRVAIAAIRTVPPLIYGLMFIRVTGPGPFAGLLTMSVCSIGMLSKMYTEAIEELDSGILESLDAAGCNTFEKILYGILPQLLPNFLSTIIYRFDMNLRDAAILGLVGAGGIGAPLIFAMSAYKWNQVGSILVGLVVLVLLVEFLSTKMRTKLTRG